MNTTSGLVYAAFIRDPQLLQGLTAARPAKYGIGGATSRCVHCGYTRLLHQYIYHKGVCFIRQEAIPQALNGRKSTCLKTFDMNRDDWFFTPLQEGYKIGYPI